MSATGNALEALFDALAAKADEDEPKLPVPVQNEELPTAMLDAGDSILWHLSIWDDSEDQDPDELLGADTIADGYEITKDVPVEFIVAGGTRESRRAKFEAGLEAIDDAVKGLIGDNEVPDRTLSGTVQDARALAPRRNGSGLATDGIPNILAASIRVRLSFTSSRPF